MSCVTNANREFDNLSKTCKCKSGFKDVSVATCSNCYYSCATCSSIGVDKCDSCLGSAKRVALSGATPNKCIC